MICIPALALLSQLDGLTTDDLPTTAPEEAIGGLGTLLWMLLLVVVIIFAGYYLTRVLSRRMVGGAYGGHMRIVDRLTVGQNRAILLVRAGERLFMIGMTPAQFTLLGEMEAGELPDFPAPPAPVADRVASFVAGFMNNRGKTPRGGDDSFAEHLRRSGEAYTFDYDNADDKDGKGS